MAPPISRSSSAGVPRWQRRDAATAVAAGSTAAVHEKIWRERRPEGYDGDVGDENTWKRPSKASGGGGDGGAKDTLAVWKWSVVYCMPKDSGKKQRSKRTYFDGFLTLETNSVGERTDSIAACPSSSSSSVSRLTLVDEAANAVASMQTTTLTEVPEAGEEFFLEYVCMHV